MKRLNPIVFIAATVFVCSCVIPPSGGRVNVRQDILSVYAGDTRDFASFTDDWFGRHVFYTSDKKRVSDEEIKAFYLSELQKMLEKRMGVWESDEQDFSDFSEWRGIKKLCLKVLSAADVRLELVRPDDSHTAAPDSGGGFITDRSIFLGPENNGLLFDYVMASNRIYSLFSPNGLQQRIRFVKKRPLNTEERTAAACDNPKVYHVPNFSSLKSFVEKYPVPDKFFAAAAGLYCDDSPFKEYRKYKDKSYIMINRHGDAFYFYKRKSDGKFAININGQPRSISRYSLGGHRYYISGDKLVTSWSPSSPLEFYERDIALRKNFSTKENQKKSLDSELAYYLHQHDNRLIDWYEYPNSKRQHVYQKVPGIVFKEGDFEFTDDFNKLPQKEFVDMLNHGKKFSEVFGEKIYDPSLGAF